MMHAGVLGEAPWALSSSHVEWIMAAGFGKTGRDRMVQVVVKKHILAAASSLALAYR